MRFAQPAYLPLLIPVLFGLWVSFKTVHGMMKARKRFAFVLRFVLAACLVTALAEPEARRPNVGTCVIIVADRSDSISEADRARQSDTADRIAQSLGDDDLAGLVVFGKEPAIDHAPARYRDFGRILSVVDSGSSDLAAAIRLATASFPDGKAKRLVILSDGNETTGDAMQAAEAAAADGVEIDTVSLGQKGRASEVAVLDLKSPAETRADQPFDVKVQIESSEAQDAELLLDRDGVLVRRMPVTLAPGLNTFAIPQTVSDSGFHRYRVTLEAAKDTDVRNNVGADFVTVRGKPRVLVVQGQTAKEALGKALANQGIVADVINAGGLPARPEELQPYDAVIFNDVNAAEMATRNMELIRGAIRDTGVGFAMIGGENSFLPGGWYGTAIAEALPVDLNVRQRKSFPSTSILIVSDTSGSMSMIEDGQPKVRLAAKAAEQTVQLMAPMDRVGVAGSTDKIDFVAPMQELKDKAAVISQIQKLSTGGGGIFVRASMEFARDNLQKENTKVRHLILLADGNDCDTIEGCIEIALGMRSQKITTSVVSIGDGKDVAFLKTLAAAGGGQFYLAKRAGQLPAIFTQDAAIMSRSAIEEGVFLPKVAMGEEVLRGIDPGSIPPLFAYCLSDARPLARVGMRTHKDDPLLASWQFGLGNSLAFTSDAQPRWAARWVGWPGFGQFWAQAVRSISRRTTSNAYQVAATMEAGKGQVEVRATGADGQPLSEMGAGVRMLRPDGTGADVPVTQVAPGVFKGKFDATLLGSYIVTVSEKDPSGTARVSASGFSVPYPPEYRAYRPNAPLLAQIARVSGGKELADLKDVVRPMSNPGFSVSELWAWFVLAAAILLPFDVASRRIALPVGEILAKVLAWLRGLRKPAERVPLERIERLRTAKQRSATEQAPEVARRVIVVEQRSEPSSTGSEEPEPAGAVSSRLLDAKRKREGK